MDTCCIYWTFTNTVDKIALISIGALFIAMNIFQFSQQSEKDNLLLPLYRLYS